MQQPHTFHSPNPQKSSRKNPRHKEPVAHPSPSIHRDPVASSARPRGHLYKVSNNLHLHNVAPTKRPGQRETIYSNANKCAAPQGISLILKILQCPPQPLPGILRHLIYTSRNQSLPNSTTSNQNASPPTSCPGQRILPSAKDLILSRDCAAKLFSASGKIVTTATPGIYASPENRYSPTSKVKHEG